MPGSASGHQSCDDDTVTGPDRDRAAIRRSVIDLALVQDQLRSLAGRWTRTSATPDVTALEDQLRAHERDILRSLRRRRLAFRALVTDDDTTCAALTRAQLKW